MKMPVLFIGHGSPENMILKNDFTDCLARLNQELPRPRAILVISAHWLTNGTYVTCTEKPKTIYDFYGFPEELYQLGYPSPGSPKDALLIIKEITKPPIHCDYTRGLDHAAWVILKHIYPKANIPVIEMSLDYSPYNGWHRPTLNYYYELGKQLSFLREKGMLIIGSGNIVHNLRVVDMDHMNAAPYEWAVEFDENVKQALLERNHQELLDCQNMSRVTSLSIPTLDHYIPMIFTIGMQDEDDKLKFLYKGFQNRSVSMRCFQIG
jgi:4,5-DOPA dioxygenase extradiol